MNDENGSGAGPVPIGIVPRWESTVRHILPGRVEGWVNTDSDSSYG